MGKQLFFKAVIFCIMLLTGQLSEADLTIV